MQAFALKVAEEDDDDEAKALAFIEIGACYAAVKNHAISAKNYLKALEIAEEFQNDTKWLTIAGFIFSIFKT